MTLWSFSQVSAKMLRLGMRTGTSSIFSSQHVLTCRNVLQQGSEAHATCCAQQCCDLLCSNVAIVWSGLANAGPTMLAYVALRCCYRMTGP